MSNGGWGGRREGAGAKPPGHEPSAERVDFEKERAEHERVKRAQREFKLAVEMGLYVERENVRQAAATALAVLTQALRSLPDNLERASGLTPEQAEAAALAVDAALTECATAFRAMAPEQPA